MDSSWIVVEQCLGVCVSTIGVLVGKDDSLQISLLPLPLHTLNFIQ